MIERTWDLVTTRLIKFQYLHSAAYVPPVVTTESSICNSTLYQKNLSNRQAYDLQAGLVLIQPEFQNIPANLNTEVTTDSAGLRICWICFPQHHSASLNDIKTFPHLKEKPSEIYEIQIVTNITAVGNVLFNML